MKYYFQNILGTWQIDEQCKLIQPGEAGNLTKLPEEKIPEVLWLFKSNKYYPSFYQKNVFITRKKIKESVSEDQIISNTIANIVEVDKSANLLAKRLREWYSLYFPELAKQVKAHEKLAEMVAKSREELMAELLVKETMGADLENTDIEEMQLLAEQILTLFELRRKHEQYLEKIMRSYCPNFTELAGVTIGAKLLELGKSLKHLAMLPASTIQLLGAEKALFRHIKTGAKSPKFGVIHDHPLVQNAGKKKGKAARMLADKLSLCARLDYFKGEFKAKEYRKELEEKLR